MDRRTYRAANMADALASVKRALGPHAVIVSSRTIPAQPGGGKGYVEIVATSAPLHASHTPTIRGPLKPPIDERVTTRPAARSAAARGVESPKIPAGAGTPDKLRELLAPAPQSWSPPAAQPGATVIRSAARNAPLKAPSAFVLPEKPTMLRVAQSEKASAPRAAASPASKEMPFAARKETLTPRAIPIPARRAENSDEVLPAALRDLYVRLVQNEVAAELAERLVRQAGRDAGPGELAPAALQARVCDLIRDLLPAVGAIGVSTERPQRVALVGSPGSGKTTAIAKLAAHFKLREQRRVALLSLDTQRVAAHEQLGRYAEILGLSLHTAQTVEQVHDVLRKVDADLLLIDTPGVAPREEGRFVRLAALLRATRPHEVHLALCASMSRPVQLATTQRFAPLRISHLMLTRMDEAIGLGVLLTTLERMQWRLSYLSNGQRVPADIEPAARERLAELILAPV